MSNIIKKGNLYSEYRKLAKEGDFCKASKLNQASYEFFYDMYVKEKNNEFKVKIKRTLERIAGDGQFIQTQLNNSEEK